MCATNLLSKNNSDTTAYHIISHDRLLFSLGTSNRCSPNKIAINKTPFLIRGSFHPSLVGWRPSPLLRHLVRTTPGHLDLKSPAESLTSSRLRELLASTAPDGTCHGGTESSNHGSSTCNHNDHFEVERPLSRSARSGNYGFAGHLAEELLPAYYDERQCSLQAAPRAMFATAIGYGHNSWSVHLSKVRHFPF